MNWFYTNLQRVVWGHINRKIQKATQNYGIEHGKLSENTAMLGAGRCLKNGRAIA